MINYSITLSRIFHIFKEIGNTLIYSKGEIQQNKANYYYELGSISISTLIKKNLKSPFNLRCFNNENHTYSLKIVSIRKLFYNKMLLFFALKLYLVTVILHYMKMLL